VEVLGIPVDGITMEEAVATVEGYIEDGTPHQVVTVNPEMLMLARRDTGFREALLKADLVVPDGVGVVWASRHLGNPVPERVAGYDLMLSLLEVSARRGYRVYFLGARGEVVEEAARSARNLFPGLQVAGFHHGYFPAGEEEGVVEGVRYSQPDLLLVGMGSPRQEKFLARNLSRLDVPVGIGVGGSFDVLTGRIRRAPLWMQEAGLEWFYRLVREPYRLGRMLALPRFAWTVLREGKGNGIDRG